MKFVFANLATISMASLAYSSSWSPTLEQEVNSALVPLVERCLIMLYTLLDSLISVLSLLLSGSQILA